MVIEGTRTSRLASSVAQSVPSGSSEETAIRDYVAYALKALFHGDHRNDSSQTKEHNCTHTPKSKDLGERLLLTVVAVANLLRDEHSPVTKSMAYTFLLHALILGDAQLSLRRPNISAGYDAADEECSSFIGDLSNIAREIMQNPEWLRFAQSLRTPCDVADLIDGRLLKTLLHTRNEELNTLMFHAQLATRMDVLIQAVCVISGVHLKLSEHSRPAARLPTIGNGLIAANSDQETK